VYLLTVVCATVEILWVVLDFCAWVWSPDSHSEVEKDAEISRKNHKGCLRIRSGEWLKDRDPSQCSTYDGQDYGSFDRSQVVSTWRRGI